MSNRLLALSAVLLVIAWSVIGIGWKNCSDNGGQYVRGTLWMTCVGVEQ